MRATLSRRDTPTTQKSLPELSIRDLTGSEIKDIREHTSALTKGVGDGMGGKCERREADFTTNIEHGVVGG